VGLELADLFRQYGPAYRQKYAARLLPSHYQAMRAIERCRTQALGGQVFACPNCGEIRYSYHSCRNRNCPKCQQQQTQAWLEVQQGLLLPVPYFLLTFTLPAELRLLASHNQKLIYHLLFRASAQATQQLAKDPRFVGGQIGMLGVLHTWTRNLFYHPHVHYLVPGGGLSSDGCTWLPARKNFFLPVKALSKLFRAAFQRALRKTTLYTHIPKKVWRREWVVHCKRVGNGQAALKYLAPYIHRVAISNRRLVSIDHRGSLETSQLTFQYRPSDTRQLKTCTLSVEHFIQRFLQHVLPRGFVKVRYFGFFGATLRSRLAALQQSLLQLTEPLSEPIDQPPTSQPASWKDHILCPKCGQLMRFQRKLSPLACRSP
jgi:predicted RNA-binding Zn-ribbon protein involved in translation (DUF1610 family)